MNTRTIETTTSRKISSERFPAGGDLPDPPHKLTIASNARYCDLCRIRMDLTNDSSQGACNIVETTNQCVNKSCLIMEHLYILINKFSKYYYINFKTREKNILSET